MGGSVAESRRKERKGERGSKSEKRRSKKGDRAKKGGRSLAEAADPLKLYQTAVQQPEFDVEFFERAYRENFGIGPVLLREDFCGTAALCCEWVKSDPERHAVGVDLDPVPIAWSRENNVGRLSSEARNRVRLVEADAASPLSRRADVISAQNFSFFFYKTREELLHYFRSAYANLADRGVIVFDMVGGSEVLEEDYEETTEHDGFDYVWEQHRFDPISAEQICYIHFRFPDGSALERAFEYRWRLWTLPELRELLTEAGFRSADVYWEGADEDGEGNGEFEKVESAPSEPAWVAYVVGVK